MAITFDSSKIATFSTAQFASANTIAKLGDDGLETGGTYHGALGALTRSKADMAENNKVRTELLRSLGQAFGLSGMSEAGGKVSFSKDFMDQLESLLGKDVFKRGDFKIGADGTVTSGRPLTSRRISAIVAKAEDVGAKCLVRCGGGEYDAAAYEADFKTIQNAIAIRKDVRERQSMFEDPKNKKPVTYVPYPRLTEYFEDVGKCLKFLNNDFEGLISENPEWVSNERSGKSNAGVARYVITDPETHERTPLRTPGDLTTYLTRPTKYIGLFEPNWYANIPKRIDTPDGLDALKNYIRMTLKTFVQSSVDLYFDANEAGKLEDFVDEINKATLGCMDNRVEFTVKTRTKLDLFADATVATDAINAEDVARNHDERTTLDRCVYEEIGFANRKIPNVKVWSDVAVEVKKELVGKVRPIGTVDASGVFTPLMEGGKPVVRAITAEDVDRIGPTCMDILGVFGD